jgi:AcrR family transcriptional regulator
MPRTEEQFKEMREKTRRIILENALKLFATKGYHASSINDIAKASKISKGLAYNYFESKMDLAKGVMEMFSIEIEQMIEKMKEVEDPYKQLSTFIKLFFEELEKNEQFWMLYFGFLMQPEIKKIAIKFMGNFVEEIFFYFESRIFGAIMDGIGLHYMFDKKDYPLEKVKKLYLKKYSKTELEKLIL